MNKGGRNQACFFMLSLISATVILSGCGSPDLLVLRDQYWKSADYTPIVEKRIETAVGSRGRTVEFLDIPFPADQADIVAGISGKNPSVVVLSPLFSQYAGTLAAQAADRRIVAFGLGAGGTAKIENLTIVRMDRKEAYLRAGALCGQYLRSGGYELKSVAGLFYSGGNERTAERAAFVEGIGEGLSDRLSVKTFPGLDGIGEVNDYLSGLSRENIGIFFVSMSGLNRDVISSIVTRYPSLIITERAGDGSDTGLQYPDRILATLEDFWPKIFEADLLDSGSEILINTVLLPGPAAFSREAPWIGTFFGSNSRG